MKFSRRSIIWAGIALASFIPASFEPILMMREQARISAESEGSPVSLGPRQEICDALISESSVVTFNFKVRAHSLRDYQDFFQTDRGNLGLRIEVGGDGRMGVVVRPDVPGEELAGVPARRNIKKLETTNVRVVVVRGSTIHLTVNDGPRASRNGRFLVECADIQLGSGFDATRTFDGTVVGYISIKREELRTYLGLPYEARQLAQIVFLISAIVAMVLIAFDAGLSRRPEGTRP